MTIESRQQLLPRRKNGHALIEGLLASGKLEAAEQHCARLMKAGRQSGKVEAVLAVSGACAQAGRHTQAARWLARLPASASAVQAVEAARAALKLGKPLVASRLFAMAAQHAPLDAWDGLDHAQAVLAAAEKARQLRGRHGAWVNHKSLLETARDLFSCLTTSDTSDGYRASAWLGLGRVLHLQGAQASAVAAAKQMAAQVQADQSLVDGGRCRDSSLPTAVSPAVGPP